MYTYVRTYVQWQCVFVYQRVLLYVLSCFRERKLCCCGPEPAQSDQSRLQCLLTMCIVAVSCMMILWQSFVYHFCLYTIVISIEPFVIPLCLHICMYVCMYCVYSCHSNLGMLLKVSETYCELLGSVNTKF